MEHGRGSGDSVWVMFIRVRSYTCVRVRHATVYVSRCRHFRQVGADGSEWTGDSSQQDVSSTQTAKPTLRREHRLPGAAVPAGGGLPHGVCLLEARHQKRRNDRLVHARLVGRCLRRRRHHHRHHRRLIHVHFHCVGDINKSDRDHRHCRTSCIFVVIIFFAFVVVTVVVVIIVIIILALPPTALMKIDFKPRY